MLNSKMVLASLMAGVLTLGSVSVAQAQDQGQPQGQGERGRDRGDRGDREGRRGNFDPAQMRQRMMDRMKEQLGASDDEWKVLQPKLEKVMAARRETGGGFGGFGGFGGRRGPDGGNTPQSAVARAQQELRSAIESNAGADDLSRKLAALREARNKARADLEAAQKDLRELLTQKQEAMLVINGMLE